MSDDIKHKLGLAAGAVLATVAGAVGGPLGIAIAALGSGVAAWHGYKIESPRKVWTPEQRAAHRLKKGEVVQEYDDESPIPVERKK